MTAQENLQRTLCRLDRKPADGVSSHEKKAYSERMSNAIAEVVADSLRERGLVGVMPSPPSDDRQSGTERRMAGGIGNKKVDVTWATEESGLMLAFSIKCINFRDRRTRNFQKNFTNRRGDMLFEAVTLHRRFPYSTLVGLFVFDREANEDGTERRQSTSGNAHRGLKLFTGRADPSGRDEQYEKLYVGLVSASPTGSDIEFSEAGVGRSQMGLDDVVDEVLQVVADRNSDSWQYDGFRMKNI